MAALPVHHKADPSHSGYHEGELGSVVAFPDEDPAGL